MKSIKNKILVLLAATSLFSVNVFADDLDDFGDFGDFGSTSDSKKTVEISGKAFTEVRGYVDRDSLKDVGIKAIPQAELGFAYNGKKADAKINLKLNEELIKNHPIDILDEIVVSGYFADWFTLQAGKMKVVWGKGDKYHVLDNFNADDYSDFVIPDYIERRISTPMVKLGFDIPVSNLHIDGIFTPLLPVDHFASSGVWVPEKVTQITNGVKSAATSAVGNLYAAYNSALIAYNQDPTSQTKALALQNASSAYLTALSAANGISSSSLYPDLMTLKYSQFGARFTGTFGSFDWGLSYYNGYYKQPSYNADKAKLWISKALSNSATEDDKFLVYDKKQTFGIEGATTIDRFNLRGEFGYNLTDDIAGDDPFVHNNSIAWLGGFDFDLPFWNMNLNVQETGTFILNYDNIDSNHDKGISDVDHSNTGYTANKLIANVTTSFINEKLAPEVTVIYGIERRDVVVMPKISYKPFEGLTLTASGMYIWCYDEDSEFYGWKKNSYASLSASYQF